VSITDELRKYAEENECKSYCKLLTAIADRIDAEHEQITHNLTDALHKQEDATRELDEKSVLLPVDEDDVPIHVGDKTNVGDITCMYLSDKGWEVITDYLHTYRPSALCHVKPDSWERIIKDAYDGGLNDPDNAVMRKRLIERCKKLSGEVNDE
jgi:hypothetical protein